MPSKPGPSTSRVSSEDDDDRDRKRRKNEARRARKQREAEEEDLKEEARELARDVQQRAREQAELERRKKQAKKGRKAEESSSESDGDNGIKIVDDDSVEEVEARVRRKRKKAKLASSKKLAKDKDQQHKKGKSRARAPVVQDDSSSEEESLVAAAKRKASVSREASLERSASRSRATSHERPTGRATHSGAPLKTSTKPLPPDKSSTSLPPAAVSKPKPTKRPSLSVDVGHRQPPPSSTARDSGQSPPLSPGKSTSSGRKISLSASSSTAKDATVGPPRPPPLRIWTPAGSRDVGLPLSLTFNFDVAVPSHKGKEKEERIPAKLESLAEVNALLEFALARRRVGKWSTVEVQRMRRDAGKGPWVVTVSLGAIGRPLSKIVEVTASAKPSVGQAAAASDKEADQAELGGKLEIVRALVHPSEAPVEFLALLDPRLVSQPSRDMGFADSDDDNESTHEPASNEKAERRRDDGGKELFRSFKQLHPRKALASLERRLKSVGDLEFAELCRKLVEVLQHGVATAEDGSKLGFGRWTGEVAASLKLALGHIHRFCMAPRHAFLDLGVATIAAILELCIDADGGAEAEAWINSWLQRLEEMNEEVAADCARRGVPKPVPKAIPPVLKRPSLPQASRRQPSPPAVTPRDESTSVAVDSLKRSRQDELSIDPRVAAKKQRVQSAQSAPPPSIPSPSAPPEPAVVEGPSTSAPPESAAAPHRLPSASPDPSNQPARWPAAILRPSDIKEESTTTGFPARRSTMSPIVGRAPAKNAQPSPVLTRASPTATRASPSLARASSTIARATLTTRATPSSSRPSPMHSVPVVAAIPQVRPVARPLSNLASTREPGRQAPTPEPTPEAEAKNLSKGPVLLQRDRVLLDEQPIADGRSLVHFNFDLSDQLALTRLHEHNRDDNSIELAQIPLRARAVFRRSLDDGATWPSISINFNSVLIPLTSTALIPGTSISPCQSFDVSRLVQYGPNILTLARWRTDRLPDDLRLAVELYRALPEPWLRANIAEDEKTFTLYSDRARSLNPTGVSLIDPISGRRIITPVRGAECLHLETFDLNTYLKHNMQQNVPEWVCPRRSCGKYAPPTSLVSCSWHVGALQSVDPSVDMLDVVQEEEAKPTVKEEATTESSAVQSSIPL